MFFEMLTQYQRLKAQLRIDIERYKVEIRIYYAERMKELRTNNTKL